MGAAAWAEGATSKRSLLGQTLLGFERSVLGALGMGELEVWEKLATVLISAFRELGH